MLAGLPLPRGHGAAKALLPLHELNDRLRLDDLVLRGVELILAAKPSAVEAVEDLRGPVRVVSGIVDCPPKVPNHLERRLTIQVEREVLVPPPQTS